MTKQIEWNPHEKAWTWRIYARGRKTSAFIIYREGVKPAGISDVEYREAVAVVREDDLETF